MTESKAFYLRPRQPGMYRVVTFGWLAVLLCLLQLTAVPVVAADSGETVAPTVLITGSNRGIGLEFARQYAAAGWQVLATCRKPDQADNLQAIAAEFPNLLVRQLDVTDPESIKRLADAMQDQPVHVLLNNAALLGPRDSQFFGQQDFALAASQYEVNVLGPVRVAEAFIDNVRAAGPGKIVTLGSAAGSNGYLRPPADFHSYRASKAALHFWMHNLSLQLADEGIIVGLINPGLVDTRGLADIGPDDPVPEDFVQIVKLIRAGAIELTTPEDSVKAMVALIDSMTPEQSGAFLNANGEPMPW